MGFTRSPKYSFVQNREDSAYPSDFGDAADSDIFGPEYRSEGLRMIPLIFGLLKN